MPEVYSGPPTERQTPGVRPLQIVIDARDTERLATFWAAALADRGYRLPTPPHGAAGWPTRLAPQGGAAGWPPWLAAEGVPAEQWGAGFALENDDDAQPRVFLQRVPEQKSAKNRVHLDL